jgi:ferritin-like metal-binding protein YciE
MVLSGCESGLALARLDQIFEKLGKKGTGKKCKGMEGVIADGKEILEEDMAPEVLDAAIISAAQHVEH